LAFSSAVFRYRLRLGHLSPLRKVDGDAEQERDSGQHAKVIEHGGFAEDDTHVAMLTVNGANVASNSPAGTTITQPLRTYQVAPTILSDLGLNTNQLDSVRTEGIQVLPGG
jgi:hypothetical protein